MANKVIELECREVPKMPVKINLETCVGCGACCGVCPSGALTQGDDGKAVCNGDVCVDCGACVGTCPTSSITQ